jgi:hypothetical protein
MPQAGWGYFIDEHRPHTSLDMGPTFRATSPRQLDIHCWRVGSILTHSEWGIAWLER